MIFADASFLVSYFAGAEHAPEAKAWWRKTTAVLTASRLVIFEAENSIRTLPLSGKINRAAARWAIEQMKRFIVEGFIEVRELSNKRVYPAAQRLSIHHCEHKSFGAMDIVHVATAQELGARQFVSFDGRQRELAAEEGLNVMPAV